MYSNIKNGRTQRSSVFSNVVGVKKKNKKLVVMGVLFFFIFNKNYFKKIIKFI